MQRGFSVLLLVFVVAILAIVASGSFYLFNKQQLSAINSFEKCAKKYPVMESYPAQCNTPDGKHFVQELSEEEKRKQVPPQESSQSAVFEETANWKTYRNEDLGFEFKYPSDWEIDVRDFVHNTYVGNPDPTEKRVSIYKDQVVTDYINHFELISIGYETSKGRTLREIKAASDFEPSSPSEIKIEKVDLGGIEWKKYTFMGEGNFKKIVYKGVKHPKLYTIKVSADELGEKVLSSFVFN